MELEQILALMDRFEESGLTAFKWTKGDEKLYLEHRVPVAAAAPAAPAAAPVAAPAAAPAEEIGSFITAPVLGTVYLAPAPDAEPYVTVGKTVKKGETVCLIEAMKMMNEVHAAADCIIEEVVGENGKLAEYGAKLFRIREV